MMDRVHMVDMTIMVIHIYMGMVAKEGPTVLATVEHRMAAVTVATMISGLP